MYKTTYPTKEAKRGSIEKWEDGIETFESSKHLPLDLHYQLVFGWWEMIGTIPCAICGDLLQQHPEATPPMRCYHCPLYINGSEVCHPSWDKIKHASYEGMATFLEVFEEESKNLLNTIKELPTRD